MEWFDLNSPDSRSPHPSPVRRWGATISSLTIHLALVGYLWAEQSSWRQVVRLGGGKGSPPLMASFANPAPAEPVVERLSPTQVLIEPDHMHVDRQMFTPVPRVVPTEPEHDDHDHPHPHTHDHKPHVHENSSKLTTPLASTDAASVVSSAAAAQAAGNDETLPAPFDNPPPQYPADARQAGISGTTLLRVSVRSDGGVDYVEVVASSGHKSLDNAAVESVRRWRFTPGLRGGRPAPFALRLPIEFRL